MAVDGYPLEDQDGYVKCEGVCGNGIFRSAVTLRGADSCECIQQEVGDNMGSKRQSKSLERLSALSIRPSSAGEASSSSGSLNSNASQSQMRQEFARPAPRIPPRPDVLVLSRFQQQRQLLGRALRPPSSPRAEPGQTPRRKYVELEVLPPKRDGKLEAGGTSRSAPQQTQSKHLSPRAARTSYAVLCIEDDATKDPRKRSQGANRRQRDRAPVRRSKSSSGDQPTPPGSRGYNMYTHARNSSALPADHLQQQNHLDPAETPKTRKPRKVSTPVITTTTTTTASVGHFPPLSVKAASVDTSSSSAATLEVGVDTRLKATSHTISAPTLHTSHGVLRTSSENLRSEEDSASSAKRPPPPNRKPPVRPRGPPVPRPRKPRTNPETNDPDYVHMMSSSAHGTLATISTTPGSSSSLHSLHSQSSSTTNTTPLPQVSAGQVRGEKGEGNGSPLDTDEEDGPYTYIDLTKNRHLMSHGSSAGTDLQKQSGTFTNCHSLFTTYCICTCTMSCMYIIG